MREEAPAGLALLGLDGRRDVLLRALARFPDGRPSFDRDERVDQLAGDEDDDVFVAEDDATYALGTIDEAALRFILAHPEGFFFP